MKNYEVVLAKLTHVLFYVLLFAMPLTGWMMSSAEELFGQLVRAVHLAESH